jgi:hypothetical protein
VSDSCNSKTVNEVQEIFLPPAASDLLESMRAIGYSFESAIADLLDNSLSAQARAIDINFSPFDDPYVAILDDGTGMSPETLTAAMRHGSTNPNVNRDENDLGRFGLGLKTASLSQCRRLTVASLRDGVVSGRCWDLDHIAARQDWMLLQVLPSTIESLPLAGKLLGCGRGTLVVWQRFDRLTAGEHSIHSALGNRIDLLRKHLALVFHRFLSPSPESPQISISINNNPVQAIDPFLTRNRATQPLPQEDFMLEGDRVTVQPYILPYISRLSPADLELAGGEEGLRRNQGFYVYRNRRLISWGSWFRLVRQEELTKLARVRVDISNKLDHLWKLDIKKAATFPPEALREKLRQIIGRITDGSRHVFTFRGKKASSDKVIHAWDRTIVRDGVTYKINRSHPALSALGTVLQAAHNELLGEVLNVLEQSIPVDAIYLDMASNARPPEVEEEERRESLEHLASQILSIVGRESEAGLRFLETIATIEPFNFTPALSKTIAERLSHE